MSETLAQIKLQNGTLIRHKVTGYEGRIDGTTGIKTCFTVGGELLNKPSTKQTFQYRVFVKGESTRRIAPPEDLEILEGVAAVTCPVCHSSFQTRPGSADKPGGRCKCGGWICPSCLACQDANGQSPCLRQQKRVARRLTLQKRARMG